MTEKLYWAVWVEDPESGGYWATPDGGGSDICLFERRAAAETLIYSDYREHGKVMPLRLSGDDKVKC